MSDQEESFESLVDQMFKVRLEGVTDPNQIARLKQAHEFMRDTQRQMRESITKIKEEHAEEQARIAEISEKNRALLHKQADENVAFRNETFARIQHQTDLINAIATASKKT